MEQATIGLSFIHRIRKESFFGLAGNASTVPIKFMVSTLRLPDPPSWLTFLQRDDLQDGFLYGTPPVDAETVHMQVVALNQLTKRTSVDTFTIQMNAQEHIEYLAELRVRNLNLEDLFTGSHLHSLVGTLRGLWPQEGDLVLVKVASLADVEGRIYVPSQPGVIIKEGALIQIGSMYEFSLRLKRTKVEIEGSASCSGSHPQGEPYIGISAAFSSEYDIDWCKFRLVGPLQQPSAPPTVAPPDDLDSTSRWRGAGMSAIERHDYEHDFILTVAVPLTLALGLLLIFSFVVFCNREGIEKRNRLTNEHQMEQFNMINLVSSNLRYMSARRDGPPSLGPSYAAPGTPGDRGDGSAPQQGQSPPPYRLPPVYPAQYDSLLSSQRSDLDLNPGQLGRGVDDQQHLVQLTTSVGRQQ